MKIIFLIFFIISIFPSYAQDLRQDKAMTHYNWGNEFSNNSEYKLAIMEYTGTIGLMPDYYRAYYRRGNAYYLSGEHEKAIDDYNEAIKLFPDYTEAFFNRGIAFFNRGDKMKSIDDIKNCIDDFRAVLRIEPNHVEARKYLEMALRLLEQMLNPPVPEPERAVVETPKPPPPRYSITIYNYPNNNNGNTQMELQTPQSNIKIIPGLPDPKNGKTYKLQVGAWDNADRAARVFEQLEFSGFHAVQEYTRGMYQVYIADVPASLVSASVQRLGNMGFREVWIRQ
jgi:tetratricopeptide (TPR) repeat protein